MRRTELVNDTSPAVEGRAVEGRAVEGRAVEGRAVEGRTVKGGAGEDWGFEDWAERLRVRTAETSRRRAARAAEREAMARRRVHGLIDRNAARLAEARRRARAAAKGTGATAKDVGTITTGGGRPIRESSTG